MKPNCNTFSDKNFKKFQFVTIADFYTAAFTDFTALLSPFRLSRRKNEEKCSAYFNNLFPGFPTAPLFPCPSHYYHRVKEVRFSCKGKRPHFLALPLGELSVQANERAHCKGTTHRSFPTTNRNFFVGNGLRAVPFYSALQGCPLPSVAWRRGRISRPAYLPEQLCGSRLPYGVCGTVRFRT